MEEKINTAQIFELANKVYDMRLTLPNDKKEIETIKRKIRRELANNGVKKPYKATMEQANYLLYTSLQPYLLKQAEKHNPIVHQDKEAHDKRIKIGRPDLFELSYGEAELNIKLDYLIHLIKNVDFKEAKFEQDYLQYRESIDRYGYPLPGYTESKLKFNHASDYFEKSDK